MNRPKMIDVIGTLKTVTNEHVRVKFYFGSRRDKEDFMHLYDMEMIGTDRELSEGLTITKIQ